MPNTECKDVRYSSPDLFMPSEINWKQEHFQTVRKPGSGPMLSRNYVASIKIPNPLASVSSSLKQKYYIIALYKIWMRWRGWSHPYCGWLWYQAPFFISSFLWDTEKGDSREWASTGHSRLTGWESEAMIVGPLFYIEFLQSHLSDKDMNLSTRWS